MTAGATPRQGERYLPDRNVGFAAGDGPVMKAVEILPSEIFRESSISL